MAVGIRVLSDNLSGQTVNVTFNPYSGGTIDIGEQTIPFNYLNPYYFGDYDVYSSLYDYTYQFTTTPPSLDDCVIFLSPGAIYEFSSNTVTPLSVFLGNPILGNGVDIANTTTKLWSYTAYLNPAPIYEYNITLNPFTISYNRTITATGVELGAGLTAISDTKLLSTSGQTLIEIDITTTTAVITPKFSIVGVVAGDIILTIDNVVYITTTDGYLRGYNYTTGTQVLSFNLLPSIPSPLGLFINDNQLYITNANGDIWLFNDVSPYGISYVKNAGTFIGGASSAPECQYVNSISPTPTPTVTPTPTITSTQTPTPTPEPPGQCAAVVNITVTVDGATLSGRTCCDGSVVTYDGLPTGTYDILEECWLTDSCGGTGLTVNSYSIACRGGGQYPFDDPCPFTPSPTPTNTQTPTVTPTTSPTPTYSPTATACGCKTYKITFDSDCSQPLGYIDCFGSLVFKNASDFPQYSSNVFTSGSSVYICACDAAITSCPSIDEIVDNECNIPTPTPTNSSTPTPTTTPTNTSTPTNTPTPNETPTSTVTPTNTPTPSQSPCNCQTYTVTFTGTTCYENLNWVDCDGNFISKPASYFGLDSFTNFKTVTVCSCVVPFTVCQDIIVYRVGSCNTKFLTPTPSNSPTPSVTPNLTPTATASNTPTPTITASNTPTPTITPTACNCIEYTFKNLESEEAQFTATDCNGNKIDYILTPYEEFTTCLCEGTIDIYNNWIEITENSVCSPAPTTTPTPSVTSSQTPTPTPTLTEPCGGCLEYEIFGGVADGALWSLTYCSGGTENVQVNGYSGINVCLSTTPTIVSAYTGFDGTIYTYYTVLDCCGAPTPSPTPTNTSTPVNSPTPTPTETEIPVTPTVTPTPTETIGYYEFTNVGYDVSNDGIACSGTTETIYSNKPWNSLTNFDILYQNSSLTTPVVAGVWAYTSGGRTNYTTNGSGVITGGPAICLI